MSAAWHGAAFGRAKRMPRLESVLGEKKKPGQLASNDHLLAMLRAAKRQGAKMTLRRVD